MHLYREHRFAFYHIPKTAGATLKAVIRNLFNYDPELHRFEHPEKHDELKVKKEMLGSVFFDKIQMVTSVRNPLATALSLYFWVCRTKGDEEMIAHQESLNPGITIAHKLTFEEFINEWYLDNWNSYKDWILIDDKFPYNLNVIRQEFLVTEFYNVMRKLGFSLTTIRFPFINKTEHRKVTHYYTPELRNKILDFDNWVVKRFYADFY